MLKKTLNNSNVKTIQNASENYHFQLSSEMKVLFVPKSICVTLQYEVFDNAALETSSKIIYLAKGAQGKLT